MSVLIGSARSSSYNVAKQVSLQEYYTHGQGYWLGFAPKTNALDLACAMGEMCANDNIKYSQSKRETAWQLWSVFGRQISNIKKICYTDCSAGVRLCIRQAFNVELPNFNTASEPSVLKKSGLFKDPIKVTKASQCTTGMVLVSPNKGHTAIVVSTDQKPKQNTNNLDITQVAKDVIKGKYGNGSERKKRIEALGLDYQEVQKKVNQLLKK